MRDTLLPERGLGRRRPGAEEQRLFMHHANQFVGILGSGMWRPKSGWPSLPGFPRSCAGYIPLFVAARRSSSLTA
jgi:hypothetical protein